MPKTTLKTVLLMATPDPELIVSMGAKLCYSKADIEEYAAALQSISEEAYATPEVVKTAPHRAALATQLTGDRLDNMDTFACTWRAYQKQKNR